MGIESGLNNLLSAGQNLQQPDLVGKYFAGSQIAQNNQNQRFQNNLLSQRSNLQERKFNRLEAQDQMQADSLAQQNAAFESILGNAAQLDDSPDPQHQQVMETLRLQWSSGDRKGAIDNYVKSVQTLGEVQTIGSPIVDDQGNVTILVQDETSEHGISAVSMGMLGKTKTAKDSFGFNQTPDGTTSFSYNQALDGGGSPTVKLSPDMVPVDPNDVGAGVVPLGGSGTEIARQEAATADILKNQTINRQVESVRDEVDKAKNLVGFGSTGFVGNIVSLFPGATDARQLSAVIDTIQANLAFDRLQAMRDGSKTGGALGQVSERELHLLKSSVTALDPTLGQDFLLRGLAKVDNHYENFIRAINDAGPADGNTLETPKPTRRYNYEAGKGFTEVQ